MKISSVAVVIPNFNGASYLSLAIESLLHQTYPVTIIVVENGSSDSSLDVIKSYGNTLISLVNNTNLGFAGGVNTGIRHALKHNYDAIALFNNDAIADKTWLEELVKAMDAHPDTGIVTGRIQLGDGRLLDSTGEFYTIWGLPYPRGRNLPINTHVKEEYVFGASGGASLYRSILLKEIGLFDESFFAYYEDTDISFRAQLAGWKVLYTPNAIVNHRQGETSKKMVRGFAVYQTFKNLPTLFLKNTPNRLFFQIGIRFYTAYLLIFANAVAHGNGWMASKGLLQGVANLPHAIRQRRHIQRTKKVTPHYIDSIIIHDLPPDQTGIRKMRRIFLRKNN